MSDDRPHRDDDDNPRLGEVPPAEPAAIDAADHDPAERRIVGRLPITRRCKVFEPISRRYVAASTRDLSPGGMRLHLDASIPVESGDRLFVGLSALGPSDLLRQTDLHESRVVWVDQSSDGRTVVGLRLVEAGTNAADPISGELRLAA